MKKKNVAILGSTGSIGKSSLEVIRHTNKYNVFLIFSNKNYKEINKQIKIFNPKIVVVNNYSVYQKIVNKYKNKKLIILNNFESCKKYLNKIEITISAIPGIAGLEPTIFFTKYSKKILIANKESIICGWHLIKSVAKKHGTELIPIDSEHFSINFLLKKYSVEEINKIYITASGGPFLYLKKKKFKNIKPEQAIKHPKWNMGKKISIDSSTLMNKVLEIIEAIKLFPFKLNIYEILIHPQSLVHSIIELKSGLRIFLYHEPDMKIPISNALNVSFENKRINALNKKISNSLNFFTVDENRFPVVTLLKKNNIKNSSPILLNAANEIFVDQFLKKKIAYNDIFRYLKLFINTNRYIKTSKIKANSIINIKNIDLIGRKLAFKIIKKND